MKKNNFEYSIEKIKKDGGLSEVYDVDVSLFSNCTSSITDLNYMQVRVDFFVNDNSVILNGSIRAKAKTICSRCGEKIEIKMSEEFENIYEKMETVDIKPLIDEALTLSEPLRSLCSDKCSGGHVEDLSFKRFKIKEGEDYAKSKKKTY